MSARRKEYSREELQKLLSEAVDKREVSRNRSDMSGVHYWGGKVRRLRVKLDAMLQPGLFGGEWS